MQIADCGHLEDRRAYLVMELLTGLPLSAHREKHGGKLPEPLAQHLVWQLASVLEVAHARDIIHCELKPSNIMLVADPETPSGLRIKLLDFGMAKLGTTVPRAPQKTRDGLVMGTPLYLAPEQCAGSAAVSAKADVYALGVLFFELLTGQPPFTAESAPLVHELHVTQPAPSVQQYLPTISSGTATLIANMLEKEPKKRPSTGEVAQLLRLMGSSHSREQDTVIVPSRQRARDARAAKASSNKTEWIRRPKKRHEPMTVQNRRRLLALSALLLVVGVGVVVSVVRATDQSRAGAALAAAAIPPKADGNAGTPAETAPVSVSIKSVPSGAAVIDLEADKKLGVTPFSASLDSSDKELWLVLRKDGFNERVVRVNLRHNSEWSERLAPRDAEPTPRPAARPTIEELKRKYESSARGSDLVKPRIVD